VPRIVATIVLVTAIAIEFHSALVRSGTRFHPRHQASVKPCQRNDTFGAVCVAAAPFALKL
jgi:hypothetical protein